MIEPIKPQEPIESIVILVITETEAESMFHAFLCPRIRPENSLCQFSDSYLEACGRNSIKNSTGKVCCTTLYFRSLAHAQSRCENYRHLHV